MKEQTPRPELAAALKAMQDHLATVHQTPRRGGVYCRTCVTLRREVEAAQPPCVPHPRRTARVPAPLTGRRPHK